MRKLIYIGLLSVMSYSCNNKQKQIEERWAYFILNDDNNLSDMIYKAASDTVSKWQKLGIGSFYLDKDYDTKLFKIVLLNSSKDKMVLYMTERCLGGKYNSGSDRMPMILGEKYKGSWWFYPGPDYVIPREGYDVEDINQPLPFSTLEKTAQRLAMSWYYKEEKKSFGKCLSFLSQLDIEGYNQCRTPIYSINDGAFREGMYETARYHYPKFLKEKYEPDTLAN